MDRRSFIISTIARGAALMLYRPGWGQSVPSQTQPASLAEQAGAIRLAASDFLRTLAPDRRARLTFAFPKGERPKGIGFSPMQGPPGGPKQPRHDVAFDTEGNPRPDTGFDQGPPKGGRHGVPPVAGEQYGQAVWTNFPVNAVPRPGVRMGDFTAAERDAAHSLLKVVLSPMGYRKLLNIMAADQKVADAGADYPAGFDVYTIALFGEPSATSPWMLQFGGHHLGLNITFVGDKAVCAPLHTGILPARFTANGETIRGLGRESDKAFGLVATFTPDQLKAVIIDHEIDDLVFGPGHPDAKLSPQGLPSADMNRDQQAMMLGLIGEWVGVLNDVHTEERMDEIRKSLRVTRFAWSGPTAIDPEGNGEAYFRVHGPSLLIEYAPQRNQGGYKVHVHTVMRDLNNDYAQKLV